MHLTRHQTELSPRWVAGGSFLPPSPILSAWLELRQGVMLQVLATLLRDEFSATGGTYLWSRDGRHLESAVQFSLAVIKN